MDTNNINSFFDVKTVSNLLESTRLSSELETFIVISALSFIPLFLITATTFTRNVIVLSILRHALGLQQSPPNLMLVTLAMFLTLFVMQPTIDKSYNKGIKPYMEDRMNAEEAIANTWEPFKQFMISQTNEKDILLIYKLSKSEEVPSTENLNTLYLMPAFLLSELKTAFTIGFIIYLPFLLLDIVVAAITTSLGMIMVPPVTLSLPLKIMLFVVVDGWGLIAETLIRSVTV